MAWQPSNSARCTQSCDSAVFIAGGCWMSNKKGIAVERKVVGQHLRCSQPSGLNQMVGTIHWLISFCYIFCEMPGTIGRWRFCFEKKDNYYPTWFIKKKYWEEGENGSIVYIVKVNEGGGWLVRLCCNIKQHGGMDGLERAELTENSQGDVSRGSRWRTSLCSAESGGPEPWLALPVLSFVSLTWATLHHPIPSSANAKIGERKHIRSIC